MKELTPTEGHLKVSEGESGTNLDFSIIIPVYNEEKNIPELYKRLSTVMEKLCTDEELSTDSYEIIMVDDGSTDRSWHFIKQLHEKDSRVRGISFSKNFGQHAAMAAGIDHAIGQILVSIDADLQAQPEDIPKAVAKLREGYNIIWAVSEKREDSFLVKFGAKMFYLLMSKIASINLPENIVFTCFDRIATNAFKAFREKRRMVNGIWSDIGFKTGTILVEKKERLFGKAKYTFFKRLKIVIIGVISYSKIPLRFVTVLGLIMATLSFIFAMKMVVIKIFYDISISGYTSIIVAVTMLAGVQLIALGIIAEYLGIVFDEVKNRPTYIVKENT